MRILVLMIFIFFFFQGCSFKSPANQWEYNSASAFNSYKKNFLTNNEDIAYDDLQRAIKYAKQSANLEQLSRIYLGKCSLNISVGIKDTCEEYNEIKELVASKELESYYMMLQNILEEKQISNLPKQYQEFSTYKNLKKYNKAFEEIKDMKQASSKFVSASLIKEKLNKSQVNYLVDKASFYGFKKNVLFWLEYLYKIETTKKEKEKIEKKLKILMN